MFDRLFDTTPMHLHNVITCIPNCWLSVLITLLCVVLLPVQYAEADLIYLSKFLEGFNFSKIFENDSVRVVREHLYWITITEAATRGVL